MALLRRLLVHLRTGISTYNIFQSNTPLDNDEYEQRTQLISTRLFITLLFLLLTVLLVYTSQSQVTHTITINSPSLTQYLSLYGDHGEKLTCPCTTIAFAQKEFISLTPIFHQVCLSNFVSTAWPSFINAAAATYVSLDFRYTGGVLFQILASFCHVANETIIDSLPMFYSNNFVSVDVMNTELFDKESQSLVNLYIGTTANAFTQSFEILRDITYTDGLVSGLFTNVNYQLGSYDYNYGGISVVPHFRSYNEPDRCDCISSPSCIAQAGIYNMTGNHTTNQTLFAIPGLNVGCYLVEAMRQSNLQCLYNQTCLDQLVSYLTSSRMHFNATALDQTISNRFNASTKISEILATLMVDNWIKNISYSSYYAHCQPLQCIYSIVGRNSFIYIFTTLIGLFGGLYKALKVTVPFSVGVIRNRRRKIQPTTTVLIGDSPNINPSYGHVLQMKLRKLFQSIQLLNLFQASPPSTDQHRLKTERISTFVYLILLTACLLCLTTYISIGDVTQTITIKTPSFDDYRALYERQGTKLSCPCSTITTQYQDFLSIEPQFHQFCSSDFIHDKWLSYNNAAGDSIDLFDFRSSASLIFYAMASYCSLSNRTISNDLTVFQSTQMVTAELLSENIFHERIKLLVNSFNQSTIQTFLQNLDFIRMTTYGNQIINALGTNSLVFFPGSYPTFSLLIAPNFHYTNCTCDISPMCVAMTAIYNTAGYPSFIVPGINVGCYTNEALRQSTFECFFNQSCIDTMKFYLNYTIDFNITALKSMMPSRFNSNTLIDEIISNMMVEQWTWNDSYSPKTPFIVVLTTLIGLFGGLVKILQILVPLVIGLIRRQKSAPRMQNLTLRVHLTNFYQKCLHNIRTFNLFQANIPADNDEHESKNQLISTRLLILLLIISLVILIVYTSRVQITHTVTIDSPSLSLYSSLYQSYGEKLTCPCTTITIARKEFASLRETYHQICTSDFVNSSWVQGLYMAYINFGSVVYNRDFRYRGFYMFQMLDSLCRLANNSLTVALADFDTTSIISTNVLPERVFTSQVNASMDLFITSVTNAFIRTLGLLRDTTQGNNLISATISSLSFKLVVDSTSNINDTSTWQITLRYKAYNSSTCSCHDTPKCVEQAYVWNFSANIRLFSIPGILIGCYTFEAMLQSNLNLFYNQTNIDWLRKKLNMTQPLTVTALDPLQSSRFQINSTIGSIVENMMIEEWLRNISYVNYYTQCRPMYCKYSYAQQNDALYIITTITALIGGLSSALQMIILRVVRLLRRFCFLS